MLCEECRVNEASFTVSVVAGEETTVRHLCADCMSKMNSDIMKGNVRSLLNTVLNVIKATADTETRKDALPSGRSRPCCWPRRSPRSCSSPMWGRSTCCWPC